MVHKAAAAIADTVIQSHILEAFETWLVTYVPRVIDIHEREHMLFNWVDNDLYIQMHNAKEPLYTLGHNAFSGMNQTEFSNWIGKNKIFGASKYYTDDQSSMQSDIILPLTVDWRDYGAVTPVKDQQQCGSCYAFSTTGALEGGYHIYVNSENDVVSFSEQQILDCGDRRSGHGCNGGDMGGSFNWIIQNDGLCTENDYAYFSGETGKSGQCKSSECTIVQESAPKETIYVQPNSDQAMMEALVKQPVSVAIQANERDFQLYSSGVLTGTCGDSLDHGVLLVGYGSTDSDDYYIMKNSWGTGWGESGYCRLGKGSTYNNGAGQCGVLSQGVYPQF